MSDNPIRDIQNYHELFQKRITHALKKYVAKIRWDEELELSEAQDILLPILKTKGSFQKWQKEWEKTFKQLNLKYGHLGWMLESLTITNFDNEIRTLIERAWMEIGPKIGSDNSK